MTALQLPKNGVSRMNRALVVLSLLGLAAGYPLRTAQAQSISPVFIGTGGSAGQVTYTYQLFATADTRVQAGDVFTFYDFTGLLSGGVNAPVFTPGQAGPAFSISIQNVGIAPPNTIALAGDDPTVPNVSLTYTGTTFINPGPGSQLLGNIVLTSALSPNLSGDSMSYAASTTKNSNSTPAGNQGFVTGPSAQVGTSAAAPEPTTFALLAIGIGVPTLMAGHRVPARRVKAKGRGGVILRRHVKTGFDRKA